MKKKMKIKIIEFFCVIVIIISFSFFFIFKVEKNFNKKMMIFCEAEISKISKNIILDAVNYTIQNNIYEKDLINIERNSSGKIESVELNTKNVNKLLSAINEKVRKHFADLENGTTTSIDLKNNLLTNSILKTYKEGIIFEVPVGVVSKSTFLSNIGPKIPVKLITTGDLESEIKTQLESYGINNALLKVFVNIRINEQILLPLSSKIMFVETNIPIITKMIQGEIPNYYFEKS